MKKILLSLALGLSISQVNAQYWLYPNVNENKNPGGLNTDIEQPGPAGWATLLSTSASPTWTAATNIPFAFNFNGAPVTQFKASSTGVVTFDVASALAAPASTNAALPNAAIPDKSACIWGINLTGANDKLISKTFGTAPNRQFWIQYNSASISANANVWAYWSVVLEETTNRIYIVDHRTGSNNGAVPVALTAGLQISATNALSVAGSPSLNTTTSSTLADDPSDNSFYAFVPGVQPANDVSSVNVTPGNYVLANANQNIAVVVKNLGTAPIANFNVSYKDGANPVVTQPVTAALTTFGTYTVLFSTPLSVTLGDHNVKVWATLANDANKANDTITTKFVGVAAFPPRVVVMEEPTGTWCGWCPRGTIFMDSISKAKPNEVISIAVHNGDPMVVAAYDGPIGNLIGGYPSLLVDRKEEADPGQAFTQFTKHIGDFGFATVDATHTVSNNVLTVEASIVPAANLSGDWRLALVPIENRVHNATGGAQWAQVNYYGPGGSGNSSPMKNSEYDFNALTSPISASIMYYDHVARDIVGGFDGLANSLPTTMNGGSTYSKQFTYTIPSTYNVEKMKYAVLFIDMTTGTSIIRNAKASSVYPTGFADIVKNNIIQATAYPNPAIGSNIKLDFVTTEAIDATINIVDLSGKIVYTKTANNISVGASEIELETRSLSAGTYSILLSTNKGTFSTKFVQQ